MFQNSALVHNKCLTWPCPFWESICNLGSVYVHNKGVGTDHSNLKLNVVAINSSHIGDISYYQSIFLTFRLISEIYTLNQSL